MTMIKQHTRKMKSGKVVRVKSHTRKKPKRVMSTSAFLKGLKKSYDLTYDERWNKPHSWSDEKWIGIITLSPQEFLDKVPSFEHFKSESSIKYLIEHFNKGKKVEMPHFEVGSDGGFNGHEGRHRAFVARKLGIKQIPVAIYWYGGYRGEKDAKLILKLIKTRSQGEAIL